VSRDPNRERRPDGRSAKKLKKGRGGIGVETSSESRAEENGGGKDEAKGEIQLRVSTVPFFIRTDEKRSNEGSGGGKRMKRFVDKRRNVGEGRTG